MADMYSALCPVSPALKVRDHSYGKPPGAFTLILFIIHQSLRTKVPGSPLNAKFYIKISGLTQLVNLLLIHCHPPLLGPGTLPRAVVTVTV